MTNDQKVWAIAIAGAVVIALMFLTVGCGEIVRDSPELEPLSATVNAPTAAANDINPLQGVIASDALADRDAEIARLNGVNEAQRGLIDSLRANLAQETSARAEAERQVGELTVRNDQLAHDRQVAVQTLADARAAHVADASERLSAISELEQTLNQETTARAAYQEAWRKFSDPYEGLYELRQCVAWAARWERHGLGSDLTPRQLLAAQEEASACALGGLDQFNHIMTVIDNDPGS